MNRQEVSQLVIKYADEHGPTNRPERRQVEKVLRAVDQTELFEGLFSLFLLKNDQFSYIRQQNAGVILLKLKPKTFIKVKERIRMCLATWDVSIEELPYYLAEKCGKERVLNALQELESDTLSERERAALETFYYWLN